MQDHLKGLNEKQREAALHMEGPILIVAGAGAGKTKTVTHRIINLIEKGVEPDKILAVTFTNKAAKEMRDRVQGMLERVAPSIFSSLRPSPQNTRGGTLGKLKIERVYPLGPEDFPLRGVSQADGPRGSAPLASGDSDPAKKESSGPLYLPFISTFHSLGVYIIKENARLLGLTKHFTILDDSDSTALVKESIKEIGLDPKQYEPRKIGNIISREKGKFTELKNYEERVNDPAYRESNYLSRIVAQVWNIYEKKKQKENSLDFDDLLLKTAKLLKENKEIRKYYQNKWEYIHIDEYQDTNEVQYLIAKLLAETHKNICVVGDADQNIYSWRGANLKNILHFEKDYPNAKIVLLEENYRSTQNILEAANQVIKKNKYRPEKNLFTKNQEGEKIGFYEALDENDEADFIATKILEILDQADPVKVAFLPLSEIAVLYRANFQSRALEETMLRYNIPYQVVGVKFFERKEVKDTLAYLRAALNKESLSDINRIINFPPRGIGKATLAKIFGGFTDTLPEKTKIKINNFYKLLEDIKEKIEKEKTSDVIKYVIKKSGMETELSSGTEEDQERLENIKELATLAIKYDNLKDGKGVEKLLEDASLASDQDDIMFAEHKKTNKNGLKLMTVHASKGLEFKYVFITGLEDGLFPHQRDGEIKTAEDAEEERRLFYVAITRAKEKLFLSFANFRTIFGSRQINTSSEFIGDIPGHLLEREKEQGGIKTIYL